MADPGARLSVGGHPVRRDALQRAVSATYARHGSRIVLGALVASMAIASIGGFVVGVWTARYLELTWGEFQLLAGLGWLLVFVGSAVVLWWWRPAIRPVLAWSGERRSAERAEDVWRAAMRLPRELALGVVCAALVIVPVLDVLFTALSGRSARDLIVLIPAGEVSAVAGLVLVVFGTELALRPLLRDVATFLPPEFDPEPRGWQLRTRVLAPLPFITLFSAFTVGAFVDLVAGGPMRLAFALAIATQTIAIAGAIVWVAGSSVLDPIDDLLHATFRVSQGDVATRVPIVTGDELGRLAVGFNRMLDALRRHQQHAAAAEEERRRLERDIHDGAQQRLAAIAMWLDGIDNRLQMGEQDEARAIARRASDELREAIEDLRRLAHGLPPPVLAMHGLDAALRDLVMRTPGATLRGSGGDAVTAPAGVAAYFAVAEGLTNALRHSGASAIEVSVERDNGTVRVVVRDDGCGGATIDTGSGLRGLQRRLAVHGGHLRVESPQGAGTVLSIELPSCLPQDS